MSITPITTTASTITTTTTTSVVKSAADIVADMIAALAVADPELDTSIGSVSRKILDVVAEQIAPAGASEYLIDWIYSIDTKEGASLDDFVQLFGIYRAPAKRAVGFVTLHTAAAAVANIPIPGQIILVTGGSPQVMFQTYTTGYLLKGTTTVTVPVSAVNAGASGNLPVGSITTMLASLSSISSIVVQTDATTGGVDAESDATLRDRFRKTVFRSLAGTHDMFLGVALEDTTPDDEHDVTAIHANIIGPTNRRREQVQISAGLAQSSLPLANFKYVYPGSSIFGSDIDAGTILTEGVDYQFITGVVTTPPSTLPSGMAGVSALNIGTTQQTLSDNGVYDLDFEYTSSASRNDPNQGITNRVDIIVAGTYPTTVSEVTFWNVQTFTNTGDAMDAKKFVRTRPVKNADPALDPAVYPTVGSLFLPLSWGPIVGFPSTLTIGSNIYTNGVDFFVVHETGADGWGPRSRFGLEFTSTVVPPVAGSSISFADANAYLFNRLPADVEERARRWKLVTTDVMAHQAIQRRMVVWLAIMYVPGYGQGVVQASVDASLSEWMNQRGFNTAIQISDILQIAHNTSGVDNVRIMRKAESIDPAKEQGVGWGIQEVDEFGRNLGQIIGTNDGTITDHVLMDNEIPVLYDVQYQPKAQNTMGNY